MTEKKHVTALLILLFFILSTTVCAQPQDIPPVLYKLFDYGTVPDQVPFGSTHWYMWSALNPQSGAYNWAPIDKHLADEEGITITLPSGEVIPKPVVIFVVPHLSSDMCPGTFFQDCTPDWVYAQMDAAYPDDLRPRVCGRRVGHVLTSGSLQAVLPAYDDWLWRTRWIEFVRAFGEHYAENERIVALVAGTGLDGETQPAKTWVVDWRQLLGAQASGVEYRFAQNHVPDTLGEYVFSFPNDRIFLNMAPGGAARSWWAELARRYPDNVGKKNSGQQPDQDIHQGYGGWPGTWDAFVPGVDDLPVWTETAHSCGPDDWGYWALLQGLHYMPALMTLHSDWFTRLDPELLNWATAHLGGDVAQLDTVWAVLRETEYPYQGWGDGEGASGHVGDWQQGLTRLSQAEPVLSKDIPWEADPFYGRQCRRTGEGSYSKVGFSIDPRWIEASEGPYALHLIMLDYGTDMFKVGWTRADGSAAWAKMSKSNSGWRHFYFTLNNIDLAEGFHIDGLYDGPEYIHMVELYTDTTPTAPTPTATSGPSLYPTNTRYPTATYQPTFTPPPTCTPTRTVQPTYTARPTLTPRPTYTEQPNCI